MSQTGAHVKCEMKSKRNKTKLNETKPIETEFKKKLKINYDYIKVKVNF